MSRNLISDKCVECGYQFGLPDFVGQPIEFRQYGKYKPQMGTKLVCPCGMVYFGWIRDGFTYWGNESKGFFDEDKIYYGPPLNEYRQNEDKGKFAIRWDDGYVQELGFYEIDLSYYETYNDEGEGVESDNPAYLITKDDERTRLYQ